MFPEIAWLLSSLHEGSVFCLWEWQEQRGSLANQWLELQPLWCKYCRVLLQGIHNVAFELFYSLVLQILFAARKP